MSLLNQVKAGVITPLVLLITILVATGAVHGIMLVLGLLTYYPVMLVALVAAFGLVVVIPFLPIFITAAAIAQLWISLGHLLSGPYRVAACFLLCWAAGNLLLLWIRTWPSNWERRTDSTLVTFWQHQVSLVGYALAYGGPSLLGCLAVYLVYLLVAPWLPVLG